MFIIQCPILWYAKVCTLPSAHSSFLSVLVWDGTGKLSISLFPCVSQYYIVNAVRLQHRGKSFSLWFIFILPRYWLKLGNGTTLSRHWPWENLTYIFSQLCCNTEIKNYPSNTNLFYECTSKITVFIPENRCIYLVDVFIIKLLCSAQGKLCTLLWLLFTHGLFPSSHASFSLYFLLFLAHFLSAGGLQQTAD